MFIAYLYHFTGLFCLHFISLAPSGEIVDLADGLVSSDTHIVSLFGAQLIQCVFEGFVALNCYDLCLTELCIRAVLNLVAGRIRLLFPLGGEGFLCP